MTALSPTITYPLSDLINFASGLKQRHDEAARLKPSGPGHESSDGLRTSEASADQYILDTLEEFRAQGAQIVKAAHVIPEHGRGDVHHSLYMQLKDGKIRPMKRMFPEAA